ncbi:small subunit ribosomal protein S17 [Salinibacter ruber]|jgi:small subunit ribosomal protein S17|uniref:Small ribosomal subunit protein uS17 n=3 Tax=Salinibacter ruber TaxID=146919 RepID=RS17_SALRD|nr:30S ribosomal protein S17 [Salinibacter ruber]Q2S3Q5.1 RecName: Full=Small ribosomal subunit protein uS17; AltName: Full=30S ribosomal protein S17 [Salinibacter ruber DSM 13855]ABC44023.1 30S ribosomal protein S17 [Salinibacter ruber DSM 13855]MBB4060868.1 small subunit ribosomal protein S17 [Salinibacter ruber]MBB4070479.1 small subunit ribosomal protein S17 [Salinibacter ruber]MBB4091241.1 small subunit ribosomal protein S17 [Salinibacter ruber]MCS3612245.1 small subunit ribosomal protei
MEQTEEHTDTHTDEQDEAVDRNDRKERIGVVESAKMDKTITVSVRRQMKHPMYGKYLERSSTFMAHDEGDEANEGDTVRIMETRPISKNKRWRLVEIIERAK